MENVVHYHVLSGLHGYMPDSNYYCKTRTNALDLCASLAKDLRDDGIEVSGRRSEGYYEIPTGQGAGVEYIEIAECWETDCKEEN